MKLHPLPFASVLLAALALFSQSAHAQTFSCRSTGSGSIQCGPNTYSAYGASTAVGDYARAYNENTIALGNHAEAYGYQGIAIGTQSITYGFDSLALGANTVVYSDYSIALGNHAQSDGDQSTALGVRSSSTTVATAVGAYSFATGFGSTTLGASSQATNAFGTALGFLSYVDGANSTALGTSSSVSGDNSTAVGQGSSTSTANSTALGSNASVTAFGAVAIGNGSLADQQNTVSVGISGNERRIVNVAAPTNGTDAANGAYVDAAQANAQTYADNLVTNGGTAASVASVNVNSGGIANAGTIGGVTAATTGDQAVNFAQLQAVFTQLVQSGLCRIEGAAVSCGAAGANNALTAGTNSSVGAGAENAIALGTNSNAQSAGAIAMGHGATAVQSNSVAIGAGAYAQSSVAVGTGAQATGTNTTALGDNANAAGNFAVAVGNNANAVHDNSVALGNGSTTTAANTVSVGSAGNERRVTNVAAGSGGTDAVNLDQLNAALTAVGGGLGAAQVYTDQHFAAANAHTDTQVGYARAFAARGIAASSAIPNVAPSAVGRTAVGVGSGYYDGESAVGISLAHAFTEDLNLSGGVAKVSGGKNVARVAVGFEF